MALKGISPIIAIVVLIALVVTLAGLISSWLSGMIDDAAHSDTCAINTMYTMSEATYSAGTGMVKVKVKNTGKLALYNFTIEADNMTFITIMPASSPDPSYHLNSGQTQYIMANASFYNITNIDTVKVLVRSCPVYSLPAVSVTNI